MNRVSWLLLSDLHAGSDAFGSAYVTGNLVRFLDEKKKRENFIPNIVLLAGDIANKGKADEYRLFNEQLLFPLLEVYGSQIIDSALFVPGNHDVDRAINPLVDTYALCGRHPKLFDCTGDSESLRTGLTQRFAAFCATAPVQNDMKSLFGRDGHYVRTLTFSGTTVGVVGINTAWLSQSGNDQDKEQLTPGFYGLKAGLDAISKCDLRIVLGHHPISWIHKNDRDAVQSLLAQSNALYLHGHLHETNTDYLIHGGCEYLALQCGALFDKRNSPEFPHTIHFGWFNPAQKCIEVEPYSWSSKTLEWGISTSGLSERFRIPAQARWQFPLPASKPLPKQVANTRSQADFPTGWMELSRSSLEKWVASKPTDAQLLSYFDGRQPRWADVADIRIPHRESVGVIVNQILQSMETPGASFHFLTGPGGEGKSTALRQVCCALLRREPNARILFRNDDEQSLPTNYILNLLPKTNNWIIVADEASNLAQEAFFQQQILSKETDNHVAYLFAARDTDWIAEQGRSYDWESFTRYFELRFSGISLLDARSVVTAWAQFGRDGMQQLHGLKADNAAELLVVASKHEAVSSDGSFLGAMLSVRYGKELRQHIKTILTRLKERAAVTEHTLMDAFSAIVAIDRLNLDILSKEILAAYLGCRESEIRKHVLMPLGDEALVTVASRHITTRHRAIANCAYEILDADFGVNFCNVYKRIVLKAISIIAEGKYVANLPRWRFLSKRLFEVGEKAMAIEVAQSVLAFEPENSFYRVHLASLFRETGRDDLALQTFRDAPAGVSGNRGFFTEWAATERANGNHYEAIWLSLTSLSDSQSSKRVTNEDAMMGLHELCLCGRRIYSDFNDRLFIEIAIAAVSIAQMLPIGVESKTSIEANLGGYGDRDVEVLPLRQKIELLISGGNVARERAAESGVTLPAATRGMSFESLAALVSAAGH